MFWRLVPALSLVSSAGALALIVSGTFSENARLRRVLAPVTLHHVVQQVLRASPSFPEPDGPLAAWCEDPLHVLSERILSQPLADRAGDANPNSFHHAMLSGRLAVTLRTASGASCTFPAGGTQQLPALRQQMDAASRRPAGAQEGFVDLPDSWISVTTAALPGNPGARLTLGVQVLSPLSKLMQPKKLLGPLAIFILTMNIFTALFMVFLMVRRIRRADETAQAWTSGELAVRINDTGRDEFARLTHKFDMMADALAGVIQVKQALAAAEERNRLARDLHDSSKQRAFALNLQLSVIQKRLGTQGDTGRLVGAALMLSSQLQQDLDSVIQRVAAPTIAESDLRHVLVEAIEALLAGGAITWSLSLEEADERRLGAMPEASRQLLLITVEAVANALKHADCSQCWISGERMGDIYCWTIADNGSAPFPTDMASKGMGLANMHLRAVSLPEGTFNILPREGGGTAVIATFNFTVRETQ